MRPGGPRRPAPQNVAAAAAMAGAVDLAAVKARSEAAARAAEAPAPAPDRTVVQVGEAGFQAEVIDRSFQLPVLLLLTSRRAPVGDQLLVDLQTLVAEQPGRLLLAVVDVDTDMRIAQALQVQGVPAVFAVIGGQLVPGFEGVLDMAELRQFVDAVLKAAAQQGVPGAAATEGEPEAPAAPEDPRFDAAETALAEGDYDLARQRFQAILDVEPANAAAALAIKQVALLQRLDGLATDPGEPAADDVEGQLAAADVQFAADDADGALERLLATLSRTAGDDRERVRVRLVEFLDLLGPDDPRVGPTRRRMAQALF